MWGGAIISLFIVILLFCAENWTCYSKCQKIKGLNKSLVLIGDSYGINYETPGNIENHWIGWADAFKILYPNIPMYESALGGSGFIGGVEQTFLDQLNKVASEINDTDEITDIIVIGGYNDVSTRRTEEELNQAISEFSKRAQQLFPDAQISMMYVATDHKNSDQQIAINEYIDIFRRVCEKNNITFVENSNTILNNDELIFWDETDANSGFHPSMIIPGLSEPPVRTLRATIPENESHIFRQFRATLLALLHIFPLYCKYTPLV